jgi:hypothetical protein
VGKRLDAIRVFLGLPSSLPDRSSRIGAVPPVVPAATAKRHVVPARGVWARASKPDSGRKSWDSNVNQLTIHGSSYMAVVPPPDADTDWRLLNLDRQTLDTLAPAQLQRMLVELSPEVSAALWHWLRFMNPGYEIYVVKPGTEVRDEKAQKVLAEIIDRLKRKYVTLDVVINRLHIAQFVRGALLTEAVFAKDRRTLIDIATPDPALIRFRMDNDPDEPGAIKYILCQWQNGVLVDLPELTCKYVPLDPFPGVPYGRAPIAPALFSALFLLSMMRDLKRVVQQQGYPRIDVTVMLDKLQAMIPDDAEDDPNALKEWVQAATQEVADAYANLEPDDAYIHGDAIQVNRPVGAVDASSLGGAEALIEGL